VRRTLQRRLDGLINAIADGLRAPGLQQRLDELGARKAQLERSLDAAPMPAPRLHPKLADVYRQRVENLEAALGGDDAAEAMGVKAFLEESRITICDAVKAAACVRPRRLTARPWQAERKLSADVVLAKAPIAR
jgi:hypothetical protein